MATISPKRFFQTLFPSLDPGSRLLLRSQIRRSGSWHSDWVRNFDQAARLAHKYRHRRDVYFSPTLQNPERAVAVARQLRARATPAMVAGCDAAATLMPMAWASLDVTPAEGGLLPDREAVLDLLRAIPVQPSLIVDAGSHPEVYWLLRHPLKLDTDRRRRLARSLVRRVLGALRNAASQHGWQLSGSDHLTGLLRVPGTYHREGNVRRWVRPELLSLHVEESRRSASDFDLLPEPPLRLLSGTDHDLPRHARLAPLRPVAESCAVLRACLEHRTDLSRRDLEHTLRTVYFCEHRHLSGRALCHDLSRSHPGYTPSRVDALVNAALRSGPATCRELATSPSYGSLCAGCRFRGKVESPLDLGDAGELETPAASSEPSSPPPPPRHNEAPAIDDEDEDNRVVVPVIKREDLVNDRALAALAERVPTLRQHQGRLVELLPDPEGGVDSIVHPLGQDGLSELLARNCCFVQSTSEGVVEVRPPRWTVRALWQRGVWEGVEELAEPKVDERLPTVA